MSGPLSPTAPLDGPLYGATFGQAVSRFWRSYARFSGRASRSELWWAALFLGIVNPALGIFALVTSEPYLGTVTVHLDGSLSYASYSPFDLLSTPMVLLANVWSLVLLVPTLALAWRRLHDTNRSGANYFFVLVPIVGAIAVLVMLALPTDPQGARFDRTPDLRRPAHSSSPG